jgi:DNA-binding response OmpR family regulator
MPRLNGPELAERLTGTRSETKVIFMSGYTTEVMDQYGVLHSGAPFIGKPFTPDLLLQKVREALDYRSPFARPSTPPRPIVAGSELHEADVRPPGGPGLPLPCAQLLSGKPVHGC